VVPVEVDPDVVPEEFVGDEFVPDDVFPVEVVPVELVPDVVFSEVDVVFPVVFDDVLVLIFKFNYISLYYI